MLHKQVFQATEQESASSVAYDTPSPKLMAFLKSNYGALPFRKYEKCCTLVFLHHASLS